MRVARAQLSLPTLDGSAPRRETISTPYVRDGVAIHLGDALALYESWPAPTVIISDGPYGLARFPGDPPVPEALAEWYEPHVIAWSESSTPATTLWFWSSEVGWAHVHVALVGHGWSYRSCHIWDKGIAHVAGNANSQTLRKFPVVSEVCVQYTKEARFRVDGRELSMQEWLRQEWERTGLPMYRANEACGVRNAATRKYLTKCHLWYYPPPEAFERLVEYANAHGNPHGRPYFSLDGRRPLPRAEWERMRAKFHCEVGVTNVWREPPLHDSERLKNGSKCVHSSQKPLRLIELAIRASSDEGDVVWEPFGGLCSAAVACHRLRRRCVSAEIVPEFYERAVMRLRSYDVPR